MFGLVKNVLQRFSAESFFFSFASKVTIVSMGRINQCDPLRLGSRGRFTYRLPPAVARW